MKQLEPRNLNPKYYICLSHQNMTPDSEILSDLIQEVINTYSNRMGISPDTAELAYITEASQLEGYGQENYPAKVTIVKLFHLI